MSILVVVESPTKARTIGRYLPDDYVVLASMGHVRDLPSSASEIPKSYRDKDWASLGVDVEAGFEPLYVIPRKRRGTIKELRAALRGSDALVIATDEDREGESIGWHLVEVLRPDVPVQRMVFHEITRDAITAAMQNTRTIDERLVRAQEARRILDRLVGYRLSPLLWRKIAPKLSAGRVQSVAVRFLVDRERQRRAFVVGSYWDLAAELTKQPDRPEHHFAARLRSLDGKRIATGKDFDENTGLISEEADVLLLDEQGAAALHERLLGADWNVLDVQVKTQVRRPYPPFTTSTLQQEAGRKLGLSPRDTMRTAQQLYESGLITYHRTDSFSVASEAVAGIRRRVEKMYGDDFLSPKPRRYRTKSRTAQEAHEAIRPAGTAMRPLKELSLDGRQARLYDLIWKRTMATQMADATLELVTVDTGVANAVFRSSGRRVRFPGFFRAYVEGSDDPEATIENRDSPLPDLRVGEEVELLSLEPEGHETKPPARFTEASLVKELERAGVGRPSTYASIISTALERGYAFKRGRALVPSFTAFAVTGLLESDFAHLVDTGFTAAMEADLDRIASGEVDWREYLSGLYLGSDGLAAQIEAAAERIDPRQASTVDLGDVAVRIGRYGPFLESQSNGNRLIAAVPDDLAPSELTHELADELLAAGSTGPKALGEDPESGKAIYLKSGPYGPYVQLGEDGKGKSKPKRASLAPGMEPDSVDLSVALELLRLPRSLGTHPESGEPVQAGIGRYGPYVVHKKLYASLPKEEDVLTVKLDRALELLAAKAARRKRGGKGRPRGRRKK